MTRNTTEHSRSARLKTKTAVSMMKQECAEIKYLLVSLLLLLVPTNGAEVKDITTIIPEKDLTPHSNQPSNHTEEGEINKDGFHSHDPCSNTILKDNGTFIESDLTFLFFSTNRTIANQCLKRKLRDKINVSDNFCENLIENESFAWDYVQINERQVLWYPIIHHNIKPSYSVNESFQNCRRKNPDIVARHMSTLPWKCGFQLDTRNYSKILVYLHIFNQTLSKCKAFLCTGGYSHLSNVTFINLTDDSPAADNCRKELETFHSAFCDEKETLCFHAFKIEYIRKGIAFITKDTNDLSATEKNVTILSKFTTLKDSPWCKHPLNYTTRARIIQNVYETFFYCYGDKNETNTSDSWVIAHISEKESIVALNGNVNPHTIFSNVMLQALIATNVTINTTVYESFEASSINLEYHTELFNIPVFNGDQSAAIKLLQMIQSAAIKLLQMTKVEICTVESKEKNSMVESKEKNITVESTEKNCMIEIENNHYLTKLTDKRSLWSPLNWIIFHNCTNHEGDKDLFLFWYNGTDHLGSICNENTVILLTSIRRANVTFIDIGRIRNCSDGSIHINSSEHCKSLIKDGSDYETRFFQFLVYQNTLNKRKLITEFKSTFDKRNINRIFILTFGFNKHPDLRGAILNLTKTFEPNITKYENKSESRKESIKNILQIFVVANLTNNTGCLEDIQNDRFSIDITYEPSNKRYEIRLAAPEISSSFCLKIIPLSISQNLKTITFNKFWPMCKFNTIVAWNKSDKVVSEWDYLSKECKTKEKVLFAAVFIITIITISGNILVTTIIIASKLVKKHAFMLYTSLALADLLIGITTSLHAVLDTFFLINGQLTLSNLTEKGALEDFTKITNEQSKFFKELRFRREGWPALTGIAMNISIMSSLMSLALLGIDCLLMLKMLSFKDKHIRIAIIATWIWNITCSLLISIQIKGEAVNIVSYFDPITKLTLNIGTAEYSVSSIVFIIQLFIGGIAGIIVVIASFASMIVYNFVEFKNNQQAVRIHEQRRGEKIQFVTRTFLMMALLFLVSCSPMAYTIINKTFAESDTDFTTHPVFHFIIWWLCLAGSSWNWVIYCFRSPYFKQEANKLWHKLF